MMVMKDGQDHHRLRVLGNHAFTPSALRRWQSVIERVVDDLLDAATAAGRMDLIGDLARPLPAIVIAELFGIPPEDREMFHHWSMASRRFFGGAVGDPEEAARAANEATVHQERYFLDLLEERRRRPGDDLMSLLLKGQADGRLTAEEVCSQCILLLARRPHHHDGPARQHGPGPAEEPRAVGAGCATTRGWCGRRRRRACVTTGPCNSCSGSPART